MNIAPVPPGSCTPDEHRIHRRLFLKGLAASGATAVTSFTGLFTNPVFAKAAEKAQKNVILLWLCGAPSQFETWDPKPGRPSSGPFGSIPTSIPGVHFSSLITDGERSCGSGGRYDPETRKWRPLSADGAPLSVRGAAAVWTGKEMLVWGGAHLDGSTPVNVGLRSGSRYNPDSDTWRPMSLEGAPEGRLDCGATWTGTELIVWSGGDQVKGCVVSGGRYDPATDHWVATANLGVPAGRSLMSSVWSGEGVLFFGGSTGGVEAFNETLYYLPDRTAAPTP